MLPVYLKIFDERLLFAQDTKEESKSVPLYTVFTGQTMLYFCLIDGDERRQSWYRIVQATGMGEDELFGTLNVSCHNGAISLALAGGSGKLQPIGNVVAELAHPFKSGDYHDVLGVDRACKEPEVFERACETMKLVFQEEKDVHVLCDNAEHRLTARYRPPPPSPKIQTPVQQAQDREPDRRWKSAVYRIMMASAIMIVVVLMALGLLCLVIMCNLFNTGGLPSIGITPAIGLLPGLYGGA